MWEKVGVVRRGGDLESAIAELNTLAERVEAANVDSLPAWNAALDAGQSDRGRENGRAQRA